MCAASFRPKSGILTFVFLFVCAANRPVTRPYSSTRSALHSVSRLLSAADPFCACILSVLWWYRALLLAEVEACVQPRQGSLKVSKCDSSLVDILL